MLRPFLLVTTALLLPVLTATPASAKPVTFGNSAGAPANTCQGAILAEDCTAHGQRITHSGVLTSVRIGHGAPEGTTQITVKLMRELNDYWRTPELVRDIGTKTVQAGATATQWSDLNESVTEGQYLAFYVNNPSTSQQMLITSWNGGDGVTLYTGDITHQPTGNSQTRSNAQPNISGVVRIPPVTTIHSGPSGYTQDASPSFTFSTDEPSPVTYECRLDGTVVACASGSYSASSLAEGNHSFSVKATNDIGQVGASVTRTFTVDHTPPNTSIVSGPNGVETSDPRPTFTFSSTEEGTFECKLDAEPYASCPNPARPVSDLADGQHTVQVRAVDQAGNVDPTPAVATFTVKRQPASSGGGSTSTTPAAWGIPFSGQTWTFSDAGGDSSAGAATDIESAKIVYDAAGRFGALVRFAGAGNRRVWVELHRTPGCVDYDRELWISHLADDNTIWATASMTASAFVPAQTSSDGREVLVTLQDARVANLSPRCLTVRTQVGSTTVDTLVMNLQKRTVVVYIPPREEIVVIMRQALSPVMRFLARRSGRQLSRRSTHTVTVEAPGPGSVGVEWTVTAKVAKRYGVRVRRGVKRVTLAVGATRVAKAAKRVRVKVKVNRSGRKVLRKAKRLKMTVRSGYLPTGGDQLLAATKSVQLK